MTLVQRLIALVAPRPVQASAKGKPAPEPAPETDVAALQTALEELVAGLADAERTILDATLRREELLLVDGSDAQIDQLDRDVEAAHRTKERLEALRPALRGKLERLQATDRTARYALHCVKYVEALGPIADARAAHERALAALVPVMKAAQLDGFHHELGVYRWPYPTDLERLPSDYVYGLRNDRLKAGPEPLIVAVKLYTLEFLEWTAVPNGGGVSTAYMTGQQAGFTANAAWEIVDRGKARFVDLTDIPPKPPKPKKSKRKPADPHVLDSVARGGARPTLKPAESLPPTESMPTLPDHSGWNRLP